MSGMRARWLAVAGTGGRAGRLARLGAEAVAVALAGLLAGCGSVAWGGSHPAGAGPQGGPPAGTPGAALRLDRQLLSRLVLPPGARPAAGREVPGWLRQPGEPVGAAGWPSLHRVFVLGWPMPAAERFFLAHPPAGMKVGASASAGDHGRITSRAVMYGPRRLPRGIFQAQLEVTVVPAGPGRALLRADAQAIWYPRRNAGEHLTPAGFGRVTISAQVMFPKPQQVARTFTARTVISRLAAVLNGLPASPDLPEPCPAPRISYQLAFTRLSATRPDVKVTSGGCLTDQITIDGKAQPVLQDSGPLSAAITRLLGVTARP
jgi:hypothetical protein